MQAVSEQIVKPKRVPPISPGRTPGVVSTPAALLLMKAALRKKKPGESPEIAIYRKLLRDDPAKFATTSAKLEADYERMKREAREADRQIEPSPTASPLDVAPTVEADETGSRLVELIESLVSQADLEAKR